MTRMLCTPSKVDVIEDYESRFDGVNWRGLLNGWLAWISQRVTAARARWRAGTARQSYVPFWQKPNQIATVSPAALEPEPQTSAYNPLQN
jgi:hypothetical protein